MSDHILEAVECLDCKRVFRADSTYEFFSIHGNLCIGMDGGIVGNNLDEEGKVKRVSILCYSCLSKTINNYHHAAMMPQES